MTFAGNLLVSQIQNSETIGKKIEKYELSKKEKDQLNEYNAVMREKHKERLPEIIKINLMKREKNQRKKRSKEIKSKMEVIDRFSIFRKKYDLRRVIKK